MGYGGGEMQINSMLYSVHRAGLRDVRPVFRAGGLVVGVWLALSLGSPVRAEEPLVQPVAVEGVAQPQRADTTRGEAGGEPAGSPDGYHHQRGVADPPLDVVVVIEHTAWIVGPLLLGLLGLLVWTWSLRRMVARRTGDLAASEARFRSMFENNYAVMLVIAPESGALVDANRAALAYYGWPRDKLLSMTLYDIVDLDPAEIATEIGLARSAQRHYWELRHRRADGLIREVDVYSGPIQIEGRELLYSLVFDTTRRKNAEQRIVHLNRVLKAIHDVSQVIVHERDRHTLIQSAVQILARHRGYRSALIVLTDTLGRAEDWAIAGDRGEAVRLPAKLKRGAVLSCCDPAGKEAMLDPVMERTDLCQACPVPAPQEGVWTVCIPLWHYDLRYGSVIVSMPDDQPADVEERNLLKEIAADLAHALHGIAMDSVREEAEQRSASLSAQLAQAQKLEAIGRLAGGVAHDFNNLLMGIMGNAEFCRDGVDADHPIREYIDEILVNAGRSADLTRQLLAFARQQPVKPVVLDVNEVIAGMLKLLRRLLGEGIDLVWMPGNDVARVTMDPSQLDQILANLCINARDAIEAVGSLTIATANARIDEEACARQVDAVAGDYVMLTVRDTGCGMAPDVVAHIFEPFFTTKGQGEGTGLGLATVYGVVRQNGGFIDVHSEPDKGTTFRIYLPRAADLDTVEVEPEEEDAPRGSETVLVVEDESAILHLSERLLTRLGYTVLSAPGPLEALQLVERHDGSIDLLLTDVVMPDMSGRELAARLQAVLPTLKCLFMSGYTSNIIAQHGVLDAAIDFMQKPVTLTVMARRVRAALDGAPPGAA